MSRSNSIIITPEDLKNSVFKCENLYVEENKKTLVIGKIKDTLGMPVKNAGILVYRVKGLIRDFLGFTETNNNGEFYLFLEKEIGIDYVIEIFKTL